MRIKFVTTAMVLLSVFALVLPTARAENCYCEPEPTPTVEVQQEQTPEPVARVIEIEPASFCSVVTDTDCVNIYICDIDSVSYNERIAGLSNEPSCILSVVGAPRPGDTVVAVPIQPVATPTPIVISFTG